MFNNTFVYDTYALIEILKENPNYRPYLDSNIMINDFIFAEFCYVLFRDKDPKADKYIQEIESFIVHVSPTVIKNAMEFRFNWKDRKVSITDCMGYFMAKELGINFLTGDKEFEKLENVEFVK